MVTWTWVAEKSIDLLAQPGRYEKAARMRDSGLTYREIGERLGGVSRARAQQIVERGYRVRKYPAILDREPDPIASLSLGKARRLKAALDVLFPPPTLFRRLFRHLARELPSRPAEQAEIPKEEPAALRKLRDRYQRRDEAQGELPALLDRLKAKGWKDSQIAGHLEVSPAMVGHYRKGRFKATRAEAYVEIIRDLLA